MKARNTRSGRILDYVGRENDCILVKDKTGKVIKWRNAEIMPDPRPVTPPSVPGAAALQEPRLSAFTAPTSGPREFTNEEHFRYVIVPYLMSDIVWDYTDTVLDIATQMRLSEVKMPCREVRKLRANFYSLRHSRKISYVRECNRKGEICMSPSALDREDEKSREMITDIIRELTDAECRNLSAILSTTYPELKTQNSSLYEYLLSLSLAIAMSTAFVVYSYGAQQAYQKLGKEISLPSQLVSLHRCLPVLMGNYATAQLNDACLRAGKSLAAAFKGIKISDIDRPIAI